jgi:hypothetical protein
MVDPDIALQSFCLFREYKNFDNHKLINYHHLSESHREEKRVGVSIFGSTLSYNVIRRSVFDLHQIEQYVE